MIGGVAWAFTSYRGIERIDLQGTLDPVTGNFTNYLLVGSDSREELDPDVPDGGESTVTGKRSDTIILLHVGPDGSTMMSIPRDLWVTNAETGKQGRINGSYNSGPANLVLTVKENLDVPVHHYMEVGFDSFAGVVDAVGGIEVEVAHPAFDEHSGLLIETPGTVTLDGDQALAYVRSRHYTEVIDGRNVEDPTADIGRQQRQQVFLQTALAEVGSTRNPVTLLRSASAMSKGLTIDDETGFTDLVGLARDVSAQRPETVLLPTKPARKGGAAVLVLAQPEADEVLATFAS
jgi:LCP family protein required for cell wall assembly